MIERIVEYSIRNPLVILMLALGIAIWGIHATVHTPVDAIPDLSENQVIVFADWPGRSPKEVEDQVTYPLSVNLQGLAGIKTVRATSEFSFSMLNIIFEEGVDLYFARQRILEKLTTATTFLPRDVEPYLAPDTTALGQIYWYTVEGDGFDIGRLRAIQDWYVRYQLYSVPGVAEVASVGGRPIEYQVDVDPNRLRSYGLTLGELYSAVARSNSSVGGRVIQKGNSEYLVRSTGWIHSLADVEQTVVKSIDGVPIHVGDIATVQFGSAQRRNVLEKDGHEAVGGVVLMRFGENPLIVTDRIKKKIEQLQPGLPPGVRIVPFYDRTRLIHSAIDTVTHTLIEESLVASAVIFLVMWHLRSALIICIMMPLSVLISFILMRQLGISSNIMSLSGIAISIGVLVDAAVVMVDQGAHTLHERFGNEPVRGDTRPLLIPALRTVGRPIFFSLAIMILSFVPVFALTGMEGKMFHPLALTKSFALTGVSILSITLVPAIIPWMLRGRIRHESDSWLVRRVIEIYRPVLNFLMDHPWPVVWTVSAICILGAVPVGSKPVFSAALTMALGLAAWSVWGEEEWFRVRWRWIATLWFGATGALFTIAILRGWWPSFELVSTSMPAWQSVATGLFGLVLLCMIGVWLLARVHCVGMVTMLGSLILLALMVRQTVSPLGREFMPPLNEGSLLDMPVTVPRASITETAADLMTRNQEIRAFPEIELVVGKSGRAETPTDPAPLDMVETVINLRDHRLWPKRELRYEDAARQVRRVIEELEAEGIVQQPLSNSDRDAWVGEITMLLLEQFDATMRMMVVQEQLLFEQHLAPELVLEIVANTLHRMQDNKSLSLHEGHVQDVDGLTAVAKDIAAAVPREWQGRLLKNLDICEVQKLVVQVRDAVRQKDMLDETHASLSLAPNFLVGTWRSIAELFGSEHLRFEKVVLDEAIAYREQHWMAFERELNWRLLDSAVPMVTQLAIDRVKEKATTLGVWSSANDDPRATEVASKIKAMRVGLESRFAKELFLWKRSKATLLKELDSVVRMPGWGNIWTQPIINRIDMLATGVNTMLGVRVYGDNIEEIASKSNEIASILKKLRGAVDVSADQIVGEGYLEIDIDRERAARYGANIGDIQETIETALGGRVITMTVEGRERFPVRIRYARAFRDDEDSVKNLLVASSSGGSPANMDGVMSSNVRALPTAKSSPPLQIPLSQVADIRIVQGPSMIRSENGLLRSYVRLNVRDRDVIGFVEEAQQAVASNVSLPTGMYIEWTGQFEHELRARRTLSLIVPVVLLTILVLLFVVYHDFADTLLVMCLSIPGAVFGGVFFQYLFGYNFSVAVWVGFIACMGLSTQSGLVILVYLREAIEQRGGLVKMTLAEVRDAVMDGAVHRARPKLMTELTTMIGLAPMLWMSGTGSEIMQPMAAPVLGGILVADEVVDLLLPVLFYRVRCYRWRKIQSEQANAAQPA